MGVVLLGLLSLQVATEDTVLFTAEQYCQQLKSGVEQQAAQQALAQLIRCPHLSLYWLSAPVLATDKDKHTLHGLGPQLRTLLAMRIAGPQQENSDRVADLEEFVPDAPPSWHLQKRAAHKVPALVLTWAVDVSNIKQAAQLCAAKQAKQKLDSPQISRPVSGIAWRLRIACEWDAEAGMVEIDVGAVPENIRQGMFCMLKLRVSCTGVRGGPNTTMINDDQVSNFPDFFKVGPVACGWDDAAWAQKGWPTSGDLTLKLEVFAAS